MSPQPKESAVSAVPSSGRPATVLPAVLPGIADARVPSGEAERLAVIERVIAELRPRMRRDGGDLRLAAVSGRRVYVRMTGACAGCALASLTLDGVQRRLAEELHAPVLVLPADADRKGR